MTPQRTPGSFLQVIFSFFLGLVLVAFVGIGLATFYPAPSAGPEYSDGRIADPWSTWHLNTSIIALVLATLIMVISLIRPNSIPVLSNGLLLGGLFTVILSVAQTMSGETRWPNFLVISLALVVSVVMGYLKFARPMRGKEPLPASGETQDPLVEERLAALEAKLAALGHALRD